ncbi:oligosaccharide repeat unit polymerase [Rhodococcus sp. IEGM 1409]|uniref:oligosaccharide repeat unit polymerase n=1 Tax=Rhodococcus sp. IEGM 1409 TaxID=3047082 RepID=UPI0024B859B5|nr:oligosaccharide repeat unit polymerase [Rhodococcus sp. IEGM 1409]MDI9898528.1 oligosaccharide repeat unit polymerase [Rhodococcus sp. IEGM 1409]
MKSAVSNAVALRPTLGPPLIATWAAVLMVVVVPGIIVAYTPTPPTNAWMGALLVTTVGGLRYGWIVGEGYRRLVEMSFWVFTYVFMGLAPLTQLRMRVDPATSPRIDPSLAWSTIMVVIVGLAAFFGGLIVARQLWSRLANSRLTRPANTQISLPRVLILSACALLVNAYYISKIGPGTLLSSRSAVTERAQVVLGESTVASITVAVAMMTLLVSFVALVKYWDLTEHPDRAILVVIVILAVTLLVTLNPISSPRYLFGTGALAVAALFGLFATAKRFRFVALSAVAALVLIFPALDAFRYSSSAQLKTSSPLESLTSPDYDAFAQINNTLLFVQNHGTTGGKQALGVLLFWVPRSIWPDKAFDTGILLAESRGYVVKNLSAPLWAELFINGGWIVLVVGMLCLGIVVGIQDRKIEIALRVSRAPTVLSCILPFYLIILMRGSLLQAMSYFVVIVGCALFVTDWSRAPDGGST